VRALALWLIVSMTMVLAVIGVLIGLFSYRLRRANRVDPDAETLAPLLWLWMPGAAPRLHRRLQVATAPIHRIDQAEADQVEKTRVTRRPKHEPQRPPNSAPQLRHTLRTQAIKLDSEIVLAARQPRPVRRPALRALGAQVTEVERLSTRLVQHQRQVGATVPTIGPHSLAASTPEVLADVDQQLDLLEQAQDEVLAIERQNGLADPEHILQQISGAAQGAPARAPEGPPVGQAPLVAPVRPPQGPPVAAPQPPPPRGRPASAAPPPAPARPQTSPPT